MPGVLGAAAGMAKSWGIILAGAFVCCIGSVCNRCLQRLTKSIQRPRRQILGLRQRSTGPDRGFVTLASACAFWLGAAAASHGSWLGGGRRLPYGPQS